MNDLAGIYHELGELIAGQRDLKHTANATAMKLDVLAGLVGTVERLVDDYRTLRAEVDALKEAEDRRKGAVGLVEWFSNHWPVTLIIAGAVAAWSWIKSHYS